MVHIPGVKKLIKFSQELRGGFGRFKTQSSFRLNYLMSSVLIDDIEQLSTASELFRIESIDFEELIQRDIDHSRVQRIANDYLSRGEGKVVFFPPLLACVVLLDDDGSIKRKYETVHEEAVSEDGMSLFRITWDDDGFALDLPIGDAESCTRQIAGASGGYFFHEFAALLKLNPKRAKLVVLDGQHRLEAMRLLWRNPEQRAVIDGIEIPICIVWAPEASTGSVNGEDMARDFRELFVRVNVEPKKVSGHFITLLKDDSYSAMAVRQLANKWKGEVTPGNWTRLHLLEWNTREDERVDIRTRDFSITTVATVYKTLEDHLFRAEAAADLLELDGRASDFQQMAPEFAWSGISDRTHSETVDGIIKDQIDRILVPALDVLMRSSSPYRKLELAVAKAFDFLQDRVNENNNSFVRLKANLGRYVYREEEMFEESARAAYIDFKKQITIEPAERVFFFAVFQQALIRYWIRVATIVRQFDVNALHAANAAVVGMNVFCYNNEIQFLNSERRYTRRMLWKNGNVNFGSTWARKAWLDLLGVTLLNAQVRTAMTAYLGANLGLNDELLSSVGDQLQAYGQEAARDYFDKLQDEFLKETKQSVEEFFSEERATQLYALKKSANDGDRKKFDAIVGERTATRVAEAIAELSDQLVLSADELKRLIDGA